MATKKAKYMNEKKTNNFQSPDLSKMQSVIVDHRTTIFIPHGADPKEAKKRFLEQMKNKFIKK